MCRSALVVEGEITESVHRRLQVATIRVERMLKGEGPPVIGYAHPSGSHMLDQLIVGDHVIVFGEFDAERGLLFNRDPDRRHLVRDDSVEPNIMYLRSPQSYPGYEHEPTVVVSLYPEVKTVRFRRGIQNSEEIAILNGNPRTFDDVAEDPRARGVAWDSLVAQLVDSVGLEPKCTPAGSYPAATPEHGTQAPTKALP